MTAPRVAVLVPRRSDGGRRDELWAFCREWWDERLPASWELHEGHHDDGPFNRAAAVNAAAEKAGDWEVAVVLDADVLAEAPQVEAAVANALETGRTTLAYRRYVAMTQESTRRVLAGFEGNWAQGAKLVMAEHVSSIVVVPRALWDAVGGFDDRFVGWGFEDRAFVNSCRVLGGGIDRVEGTVFHCFHASAARERSRLYRAAATLAGRYDATLELDAMRRIVAERAEPDGVLVIVITNGRRECIAATIASAEANLVGLPIVRRVISDDSQDLEYRAWLRHRFPDWELTLTPAPPRVRNSRTPVGGFAGAVRHAWQEALRSGQRWTLWLEDDFTFERPVDLAGMAAVLAANPHVLQMALRRQAWSAGELKAGGIVEERPDGFEDHSDGVHDWLEHSLFWTTNPHLIERRVLLEHDWPLKAGSEHLFGRQVLRGDARSGYWGPRTDPPAVHHDGAERVGTGY